MKHIVHTCAPPTNVGDAAIRASMRENLERLAGERFRWTWLDIQRTRFDIETVARINAEADLLIVGGGGLIMDRETNGASGWQWDIALRELDALRVPLVLYALGWNEFPYGADRLRDPAHRRRLAAHLWAAFEAAAMVSFRNEESAQAFAGLRGPWRGIPAITTIPDPAFFLEPEPCEARGLREDALNVGVCWAGDRPERRWPDAAARLRVQYAIRDALTRLARERPVQVIDIPHVVGLDGMPDIMLQGTGAAVVTAQTVGRTGALDVDARKLADLYRRMDVVLGMRKHSVILPLGQGTPTIGLGDQAEVRWTLEDCGLDEWLVTSENATADGLCDLINLSLRRDRQHLPDDWAPIWSVANEMADREGGPTRRERFDAFNRRVLTLMGVAPNEHADKVRRMRERTEQARERAAAYRVRTSPIGP